VQLIRAIGQGGDAETDVHRTGTKLACLTFEASVSSISPASIHRCYRLAIGGQVEHMLGADAAVRQRADLAVEPAPRIGVVKIDIVRLYMTNLS
jgi:hypothetical protein